MGGSRPEPSLWIDETALCVCGQPFSAHAQRGGLWPCDRSGCATYARDWAKSPQTGSSNPTPDPIADLTTHTERMRQTCAQLADEIADVAQVLTVGGPVDHKERAVLLEKLARMQRAAAEMAVRQ